VRKLVKNSALSLLPGGLAAFLGACSGETELDFSEKLTIAMLGTYEEPAGAAGNADPKFVNVTFIDASLTRSNGAIVDLFEGEPTAFRIINRSQILHEVDMSSYVDETLSAISVSFEASVTAGGKLGSALESTLLATTVSSASTLTVESAIQKRLEIHLQWKNTITLDESLDPPTETLGMPGLSATLEDD
jgi:hypothetical protein